MPEMVWECNGHGAVGTALVSAPNRAIAVQACYEWLGWEITVAFRAPERYASWMNCGGTAQTPVVYATDDEHYSVVEHRMELDMERGTDTATMGGWEERYERE
jgi:hypothetical protein